MKSKSTTKQKVRRGRAHIFAETQRRSQSKSRHNVRERRKRTGRSEYHHGGKYAPRQQCLHIRRVSYCLLVSDRKSASLGPHFLVVLQAEAPLSTQCFEALPSIIPFNVWDLYLVALHNDDLSLDALQNCALVVRLQHLWVNLDN